MVNAILKRARRLKVNRDANMMWRLHLTQRLRLRHSEVKRRIVRPAAGLALGAALLLAGCAGPESETQSEANTETPPLQSNTEVSAQTQAVKIPSPENFTTVGKPTKTIETPKGLVEIYDPTQDPEVWAAFHEIYNSDYQSTGEYYALFKSHARFALSEKDGPNGPWHVDDTARIIFDARKILYQDVMRSGCAVLHTSSCNTPYNRYPATDERKKRLAKCNLSTFLGRLKMDECESDIYRGFIVGSPNKCELNGENQVSIWFYPIGPKPYSDPSMGIPPPPRPAEKEQFTAFFNYQCAKWGELD